MATVTFVYVVENKCASNYSVVYETSNTNIAVSTCLVSKFNTLTITNAHNAEHVIILLAAV